MGTVNFCDSSKKTTGMGGGSSLRRLSAIGLIVTMGIVFGDIGTSPLYVMKPLWG